MLDVRLGPNGEVVLAGRFDAAQADKVQAFLDSMPEARRLDFGGLEYISSAGLGVLLKTQKRLMASGSGLVLVNVGKHIYDIFHYSGFDQIFTIEGWPRA